MQCQCNIALQVHTTTIRDYKMDTGHSPDASLGQWSPGDHPHARTRTNSSRSSNSLLNGPSACDMPPSTGRRQTESRSRRALCVIVRSIIELWRNLADLSGRVGAGLLVARLAQRRLWTGARDVNTRRPCKRLTHKRAQWASMAVCYRTHRARWWPWLIARLRDAFNAVTSGNGGQRRHRGERTKRAERKTGRDQILLLGNYCEVSVSGNWCCVRLFLYWAIFV